MDGSGLTVSLSAGRVAYKHLVSTTSMKHRKASNKVDGSHEFNQKPVYRRPHIIHPKEVERP